MNGNLNSDDLSRLLKSLAPANAEYLRVFPGESLERQPVHVVYGGAHLFKFDTTQKIRDLALKHFREYAKEPGIFKDLFGWKSIELARKVFARVDEKLNREAVEDFRIDFEDGFGTRGPAEEDAEAIRTATELARGQKEGTLPPFTGIRVKPLSEELKHRSLRTLDLFISTLAEQSGGKIPNGFVITLPKIVHTQQITTLVDALEILETKAQLPRGSLRIELMVETPQSIVGYAGESALPGMIAASRGRCRGAHFGTYDYTAALGITAEHQKMDHSVCDFARNWMKVSLAGTGIWISDGATNLMPIAPHKEPKSLQEEAENREAIQRAWQVNYRNVHHSLKSGFYQGWDLHPAQLPIRYAAVFAFFWAEFEATSKRLKNFIDQAAKATLVGNVFDDAATGQGLLNFFLRAINCGAVTEDECLVTGLTREEIEIRSFYKIIEGRNPSPRSQTTPSTV